MVPFVIKLSLDNIPAKLCSAGRPCSTTAARRPLETYLLLKYMHQQSLNFVNLKHISLEIIIVQVDIQTRGQPMDHYVVKRIQK
jgi:hypothetical protein